MTDLSPEVALAHAIARLFRTSDGTELFRHLQRQVMRVTEIGAPTCALHELEGRRRFALELLNMVDADQKEPDAGRDRSKRRYRSKPGE